MFFWHPHPTFDFWHHHSRDKHHDPPPPSATPSEAEPYEVSLEPKENPQELPLVRRWLAVMCISSASICVTCASSMVRRVSVPRAWDACSTRLPPRLMRALRHARDVSRWPLRQAAFVEMPVARQFHVSKEVAILGVSLFVLGLGLGPLVAGPMSETYGRNAVYRLSFSLFFACMFPVAFAPNISVYLIFRFISGYCGAAFLSVAGGSVSDMFSNAQVATPMAVYTICPFLGPELGPILSGFINQHLRWRWTFYILIIWSFVQAVALIIVVPETYIPVILKMKAKRLRETTGDPNWYASMEKEHASLMRTLLANCYKPFYFLLSDHMALLLNLWDSLILGILYLTFQAFPIVFEEKHGFNLQSTGLTFLGIATGMLVGLCTMPYWNRKYRRYQETHGRDPGAEFRLLMGQVGGVLVPLALLWFALSTFRSVHWIVPVLASVPFGTGTYFIFTSSFTYIVVAYRPIAASALASNTTMRTSFAAAFPLFAGQMCRALGTVGAMLLLAGLTITMAPLPYVHHIIQRPPSSTCTTTTTTIITTTATATTIST
ncbi:MFS general substrate transporter [Russula earlei]|uniref:MFS general substrate transporter n=1 Tax=Russula earlei TaxID=71964 RepID=A0ACC0TWR3_9AGAM|nr:MFS general substrate transporter [Russula earlei]